MRVRRHALRLPHAKHFKLGDFQMTDKHIANKSRIRKCARQTLSNNSVQARCSDVSGAWYPDLGTANEPQESKEQKMRNSWLRRMGKAPNDSVSKIQWLRAKVAEQQKTIAELQFAVRRLKYELVWAEERHQKSKNDGNN
jgi:hypothetical protein